MQTCVQFNIIFFLHFSAHAEHYTIIDSPSSEIHLIGEITEMRYVAQPSLTSSLGKFLSLPTTLAIVLVFPSQFDFLLHSLKVNHTYLKHVI